MIDPIEQAFGRYNVAVTTGRNVLPSANAYSALLDERQMAVERAILHHHPDVVRLVLAARALRSLAAEYVPPPTQAFVHPDNRDGAEAYREHLIGRVLAEADAALDPFKEVQE